MRWIILATVGFLAAACGDGGGPNPTEPTRGYRLGFSAFPPRPTTESVLQGLDVWPRRADIAIVHEELPWAQLVAGVPPDTILAHEKRDLIAIFRQKGLELVFIADATDGLARQSDPPQLRALGRSIVEPEIQQLFVDYLVAFVRAFHPEYVGLGAETNLVRQIGPKPLYQAVVTVANAGAAALAALPDRPLLFVSVQVEVAWGKLAGDTYLGVEQDFADFPFIRALGLSSYPYFVWADPAALPDDYYGRLLAGRSVPVMVVEGGWASQLPTAAAGPATQARYIARQAELLAPLDARALIQLTFTDIDLTAIPDPIRQQLVPFATLGLVDADFRPKPALAVWDSLFALGRR